jgi:phosphotransferase system HPr (HPr) family protein
VTCPTAAGRFEIDDPTDQDTSIAFKRPSMTETRLTDLRQVVLIDPLGLHLRPAAKLVVLSRSFRSDIRIIAKGTTADAKSLLGLVALAAGCDTTLDIIAHGPDAEGAVAALTQFFVAGLDGSASQGAAAA